MEMPTMLRAWSERAPRTAFLVATATSLAIASLFAVLCSWLERGFYDDLLYPVLALPSGALAGMIARGLFRAVGVRTAFAAHAVSFVTALGGALALLAANHVATLGGLPFDDHPLSGVSALGAIAFAFPIVELVSGRVRSGPLERESASVRGVAPRARALHAGHRSVREDSDALVDAVPLTAAEAARHERAVAFRAIARRAVERRRREREAIRDLVPNDGGFVYGPTFAEIVVDALRVAAHAPLLALPAFFLVAFGRRLVPMHAIPSVFWTASAATLVAVFLALEVRRVGERPLTRVRARVFEKGKRDVHAFLALVALNAVVAALIALRG